MSAIVDMYQDEISDLQAAIAALAQERDALRLVEKGMEMQINEYRDDVASLNAELAAMTNSRNEYQYEVDRMAMAHKVERDGLRAALAEYANPVNWSEDFHGKYRKWLEPHSDTPRAYNGFELAQNAMKGKS